MTYHRLLSHHLALAASHPVLRLLLLALIITGIVLLTRALSRRSRRLAPLPMTAEQVLDTRYARGDINAEEYRSRRETLWNTPQTAAH